MRRFFVIFIPVATIALFILIMLSENYFKMSPNNDTNVPSTIETLKKEIGDENWQEASIQVDNLLHMWDDIVKRVQFSAERNEIDGFYISIARLKGAIAAKDKSNSLIELSEAYEHWESIGK
jgi:hypothetical protein